MAEARKRPTPRHTKQLLFSLLAAVIITVLVVLIVTAAIGPGLDSEELHDLGIDDRLEELEELREEQRENSGSG